MTKITTQDCVAFIVDFETRNPQIELARFDGEGEDELVWGNITNKRYWKRRYKIKLETDNNHHEPRSVYRYYGDGIPVNRYVEPQLSIPSSQIVWVRDFECEGFDGQIAYLVLETTDGRLLLGPYTGD